MLRLGSGVPCADDFQLATRDKKLIKSKAKSTNMIGMGATYRHIKRGGGNGPHSLTVDEDFSRSCNRRKDMSNEINTFFHQINEFVRVTLKFKETITQAHLAQIRRLGRQIGLKFGCVKELDAKFINSKDFVAILKSKIFCMLNGIVMKTGVSLHQSQDVNSSACQKTYKFYVEPSGNNHTLVRSVIKRRGWFSSQELSQEHGWSGQGPKLLNLIWT